MIKPMAIDTTRMAQAHQLRANPSDLVVTTAMMDEGWTLVS